jgi:type VI secretion system secreted protein Hcp
MVGSVLLTLLLAVIFIPGQGAKASANLPAATSLEIFAKIDTIPGDSTNAKFVHQIPVESFSFASGNSARAGAGASLGGGAGKVMASPITFTAAAGSDSPLLLKAVAKGTHLTTAVFSFVHSAGDSSAVFQTYTLGDCSILSFHQTAQQGGVVDDEVQISFTKVTYTFTPQNPDGSLGSPSSVTWDLKTNTVS